MGKLQASLFTTGVLLSLAGIGCGGHNKTPVSDIQTLRDNGSAEMARGPVKPQIVKEYVEKKVPVEVVREREVIKYITVKEVKEMATVSKDYFKLAPDETAMIFEEGKSETFGITAFSMVEGVKVGLSIVSGAPEGVDLKPAPTRENPNGFALTWAPAAGTLGEKSVQIFKVKIQLHVIETPNADTQKKVEGILVDETVTLVLTKGAAGAVQ